MGLFMPHGSVGRTVGESQSNLLFEVLTCGDKRGAEERV